MGFNIAPPGYRGTAQVDANFESAAAGEKLELEIDSDGEADAAAASRTAPAAPTRATSEAHFNPA